MDRFEWLLSAQVTMGAGVAPVSSDVPYLGSLSLSPGVQTCHRAVAGTERTGASQFGPIHITLGTAAWDGITILALRLGLLKVSFKGRNWMNKSI